MFNFKYLEKSDVPAFLIGSYNGRKFKALVTDTVELTSMHWGGGTRSTYTVVDLATRAHMPVTDPRPWPQSMTPPKPIAIKPGFVVREHSTFCGKDSGLIFHVHPSDVAKLLPVDDGAITDNERIVLKFTGSLKNTYGGRTNIRFVEANRVHGISQEDWTTAQTKLIESEHLRKNGSITPKGRNVDASNIKGY